MNIYDEIDDAIDEMDEHDKREAYLSFFRTSFAFTLCPTLFKRSNDLPNLAWNSFKYSDHENNALPDEQGVYMFMVSFENNNLPNNSYVMYVGKAGDINSNNTIANRFQSYARESGYRGRIRVRKMIQYFSDHLTYYYATIPAGSSTAPVEQALADIFVPPCCQVDFSAEVRTLLRGARLV